MGVLKMTKTVLISGSRKLHYTGSINVMKTRPAYGYLDFPNAFPVLQLATHLPDFRFRMYRNNMIYGIVADLVSFKSRKRIMSTYYLLFFLPY